MKAVIYLDPPLPMGSSEILRASTGRLKRSFVSCSERGLHRGQVAMPRVSSYLTFPPLHVKRAVSLCCTFPGVAPAGCYPALCPVELGLSSHLSARGRPATSQTVDIIARSAHRVKKLLDQNDAPAVLAFHIRRAGADLVHVRRRKLHVAAAAAVIMNPGDRRRGMALDRLVFF